MDAITVTLIYIAAVIIGGCIAAWVTRTRPTDPPTPHEGDSSEVQS